jgi:transcription elongation factor Elf1
MRAEPAQVCGVATGDFLKESNGGKETQQKTWKITKPALVHSGAIRVGKNCREVRPAINGQLRKVLYFGTRKKSDRRTPAYGRLKMEKQLFAPCPGCGEESIALRLGYLPHGDALVCSDCDLEFSLEHVRTLVETWGPILTWIDAAPYTETE